MSTYRITSRAGVVARVQTAPKKVFRVDGALRGPKGPQGPQGDNIELQSDGMFVQWRIAGSGDPWNNLVNLFELAGVDGREVELQNNGTTVQWRYVGDVSWIDLIPLASIMGADGIDGTDGREVEIQNTGTYVQWRYVGDVSWTNLISIASITGADGTNGTNGTDGTDGYAILSGSGAPSGGTGQDGDFYINTANYTIYGPKTAGSWGSPTSLVGPVGAGTGDMLASVYDPTNKIGDAFSMYNMAETATKKILSDTERTKLAGIAIAATANSSDATLLARANHTGTQSADTLTDGTTNKAFLATERTKLAGISIGANVTATTLAPAIFAATAKTTPVDADTVGITDSAASNGLKKVTWANIKATLKAYFDTFYATISNLALKADDNAVVKLTGNQTVAGIKTFSSSPVVPTASPGDNSTKAASTAYVDAGFGSNSFVRNVGVTGTKNGSNTAFTTPNAYISGSIEVWVNGIYQTPGDDFTETTPSSGTFALVVAPISSDDIRVSYQISLTAVTGNADTVDGIHASSTPSANKLLALDSSAKVPWSALSSVYGESVLGSNFTMTNANNTYQDTGLSLSLPAAGTYELTFDFRSDLVVSAGAGWSSAKLYDSTAAADVPNSNRIGSITSGTGVTATSTSSCRTFYTVTGATTIKLYSATHNNPTWSTRLVVSSNTSSGPGYTNMTYKRIA